MNRPLLAVSALSATVLLASCGSSATTTPAASGTTTTSQTTQSPATSASGPATNPASAETAAPNGTVPVYSIGDVGDGKRYALYRDFLSTTATNLEAKIVDAVNQSLAVKDGPWQNGVKATAASVNDTGIKVTLNTGGQAPPTDDPGKFSRLGVQQLTWTAQAVVGKGNLPVSFVTSDGSKLLGQLSPAGPYTRPSDQSAQCTELAPIWVTEPASGATVSSPVTIKGSACVFEANVQWELTGGPAKAKGTTTASIGAPARGEFSVSLGKLTPGTYTFTAYESDMATGKRSAQRSISFTVR